MYLIDKANRAHGLRHNEYRLTLFVHSDDELVGDKDVLWVGDEVFLSIFDMDLKGFEGTGLRNLADFVNVH